MPCLRAQQVAHGRSQLIGSGLDVVHCGDRSVSPLNTMRADSSTPSLDPVRMRELFATIASGDAILFTGAGFSTGATDLEGRPLPDSEQMRQELWRLVFADDPPDDSTLQDLYDVALIRAPDRLAAYLERRLRVQSAADGGHIARWFSLPWRRVYTLNVDDLETAVQRTITLPRPLRTVSACQRTATRSAAPDNLLEIMHLNGIAGDGAEALTFSTLQYAARLCGRDPTYAALVDDLMHWPFVFVGTSLDEVVLWQHLELQRRDGHRRPPEQSYLIARSLSRARQLLLEHLGIAWLQTTAEEVASWFDELVASRPPIDAGRSTVRRTI